MSKVVYKMDKKGVLDTTKPQIFLSLMLKGV
jgi:hypothetical protein